MHNWARPKFSSTLHCNDTLRVGQAIISLLTSPGMGLTVHTCACIHMHAFELPHTLL